jgi:hypothetical protein
MPKAGDEWSAPGRRGELVRDGVKGGQQVVGAGNDVRIAGMSEAHMKTLIRVAAALSICGCAHRQLASGDLNRVQRPAFVSWIADGAGPKAGVFREDSAYEGKLKRLDAKEADRRLQAKLAKGMSRFETSDRLRAVALANLPRERPWINTVDPASVASALESFLVEEVPANPPDYELLKPLGADSVVEFVIEDYGMRSSGGRARAYVSGYGRMFLLGSSELWHESFRTESAEAPGLDPFQVGQEPELFRAELAKLLDSVALQFARDLNPEGRPNIRQIQQEQQPAAPAQPKEPPKDDKIE